MSKVMTLDEHKALGTALKMAGTQLALSVSGRKHDSQDRSMKAIKLVLKLKTIMDDILYDEYGAETDKVLKCIYYGDDR